MSSPRDILNRARWASGDLESLAITIVHRGAPGDRRTFSGARVVAILPGGVELTPESEASESAFVPYHRFLSIEDAHATELWTRRPSAVAASTGAVDTHDERGREVGQPFEVVLPSLGGELTIDGSAGEGGGQILRTSLALSLLLSKPFVIERIRASRAKPGLMRQHLMAVRAAAAVSQAEVEGAELGSDRLVFRPGPLVGGDLTFDIGSAGSCALVLQTVALPLALARESCRIRVRGGTHATSAPVYEFLARAWLPLVRQTGADLTLSLQQVGFYPAGGGDVLMEAHPSGRLLPLHLAASSGELELTVEAISCSLPEHIAERELASARELLGADAATTRARKVRSPGPGNAVWLVADDRVTGVCNLFSAIGERGRPAEEIGREAALAYLAWRESGASVEAHLADQLMLPIAIAGEGSYSCNEHTLHSRTNIEVIAAFTGRRLRVFELAPTRYLVALGPV